MFDAIVDALKDRDPDRAEQAMRRHIQTSASTLLATIAPANPQA